MQVEGEWIPDGAKPKGSETLPAHALGCWRGHANVWTKMITDKVQTALILEDDADWDVHVHHVFEEFSAQLAKGDMINDTLKDFEAHDAPYGRGTVPASK
jgi:GR25 family glycosyltransferase involved in LPS biosynthesis